MRLRWTACALVLLGILAVTVPVEAQGLNEVLTGLLSNNCAALGKRTFGPELALICGAFSSGCTGGVCADQAPGGGGAGSAASAGGTGGAASRGGESQILRRLRQRQAAASADDGDARGLSLFGSTDYQKFDKDTTPFESGFQRDTTGGTVGADYLLHNGLVLGGALSYAHEFGNYEGVGGGFDHDAYGILLYGSVVPFSGTFVDVVAGYTRKDYRFDRRASLSIPATTFTVSGAASGETAGNEFRLGVNLGHDFLLGRFSIGPRAGVLYRETTMDGFRESGRTGLELAYDNQNMQSLITTVGLYGSVVLNTGFGVIVPQATVEYVHEFLDDQRNVGFSFVQDPGDARFLFETDPPDRDYFNLGVGVAMVLPNGLQPFLNYVELLGYQDRRSHAVTLGLRVPF
ncbi:MAG TPA: autotransporter outer membrane beta-barrel domain-containing protein [Methylomirabilota bacterium]|nr:autotransporter outer membrane beta-barrel domain-containing protein [Methylomirabilota bacterium]